MLAAVTGRLTSAPSRKEDTSGTYLRDLALAWLPFSVDRALAISETLPEKQENSGYEIRDRTLVQIAVWLLTDPAKRSKRLLTDYDQYGFDAPDY